MVTVYVSTGDCPYEGMIVPDIIRYKKQVTDFIRKRKAYVYPCFMEDERNGGIIVRKGESSGRMGWFITQYKTFTEGEKEIHIPDKWLKKQNLKDSNDANLLLFMAK